MADVPEKGVPQCASDLSPYMAPPEISLYWNCRDDRLILLTGLIVRSV